MTRYRSIKVTDDLYRRLIAMQTRITKETQAMYPALVAISISAVIDSAMLSLERNIEKRRDYWNMSLSELRAERKRRGWDKGGGRIKWQMIDDFEKADGVPTTVSKGGWKGGPGRKAMTKEES